MATPTRLVALDGTWLVHRATYAASRLSPDQRSRVVPMQVCAWLYSYALIHKARLGLLAFDGPLCFRYDIYPLYKANRLKVLDSNGNPVSEEEKIALLTKHGRAGIQGLRVKEETTELIDATKEVARHMQLPVVNLKSFEADDVLCSAGKLANKDLHVVMVAKDKDMFQGLRQGVSQWYPDNDPKQPPHHIQYSDLSSRLSKYVHPDASHWTATQFLQYQCLVGDKTDSVPEILSRAKARAVLNEHGSLGVYFKTAEGKEFYARQQEFLIRNRKLVEMRTDLLGETVPDKDFRLPVNTPEILEQVSPTFSKAHANYEGWLRMFKNNRSLF